jgi:hypothetical protein
MVVLVEKSSKAKKRQREVAQAYQKWLKNNPKANIDERIKQLDFLSDTAFLRQTLDKNG